MRILILSVAMFSFTACSGRDDKMCDCLEVSEKLNVLTSEALQGEITQEQKETIFKVRAEKAEKCKEFETMSGEKMLKMKATCE
ncbi:MAG: hypothetical protein PHQ74_02105 [Crocinitomicaceae bacterium]|nr:hypothetical protein [Crocinitomicaceae bacterium]